MGTKGKLLVIEGVDGSGKTTQIDLLYKRLQLEGIDALQIAFPDYESPSSALVKMYLEGQFSKNPEDIGAEIASTFYTLDRYASYITKWRESYINGGFVICARYTTSNMVHQAAKINCLTEKDKFLDWLWDFEYNIFGLPVPDRVIFLDMPPEFSQKLREERKNSRGGNHPRDIHEDNLTHMQESYLNAAYIAKKYGWSIVKCVRDGKLRDRGDIADEIYNIAKEI